MESFRKTLLSRYQIVAGGIPDLLGAMDTEVNNEKFTKEWLDQTSGYFHDTDFWEQLELKVEQDEDGKDIEPTEDELKAAAENWIGDRWSDFSYKFRQKAEEEDGQLVGWRCVGLDDVDEFIAALKEGKYLKGHKGIGVYFSWNEGAAECHWGKGSHQVTVQALIPFKSIDVPSMAWANMNMSTGNEDEITLIPGAALTVVAVWDKNKDLLEDIESLPAVADS